MAIDWQKWKVSYLHMVFQWKPPFIDIGYFPAMFDDTRGHIPLNPHHIPIKDTTVDRLKLPDGNQKNYIQVLSRMSFPSLSPFILLISPLCHHSPHDIPMISSRRPRLVPHRVWNAATHWGGGQGQAIPMAVGRSWDMHGIMGKEKKKR